MSDDKKPSTTQYELPTGAIAMLEEIIPQPQWYKDDPKQGFLIVRATSAFEALPDTAPRIKPEKEETKEDFEARADDWAKPGLMFEWTDKQKDAVKVCVRYFLKQGAFAVNTNTVALLHMLGLDDE